MAPGAAHAGAWVAPDEGQAISAFAISDRDETSALDVDLFIEQPFAKGWSVVTQARLQADAFSVGSEALGAAKRAWAVPAVNGAFAVQAGVNWREGPALGCEGFGGETRLLAGAAGRSTPLFVNIEAAYRAQSGGCGRWQGDVTVGLRPSAQWLTLGQVFYDADLHASDVIKVQMSAVRFLRGRDGIQIGVRARIDGGEPEPALVIGWWRAARDN